MSVSKRISPPKPESSRIELYRALADEQRLKILALCSEEKLSMGELTTLLNDSQPQISRKAVALKALGLLKAERDGQRIWMSATTESSLDPVVKDALTEGKNLCLYDGSWARIAGVVAAREAKSQALFDEPARSEAPPPFPAHLAHLAALAPLLPSRQLAIDVGTGDGMLLDVLAPLFQRVIAVDRSRAQLARVANLVTARGFGHVSLYAGSYDDTALLERVDAAQGADLVFAGRTLHHASRPAQAVQSFARLLKKGGHLVILDYLPHHDDALRAEAGDVWLGFSSEQITSYLAEAKLQLLTEIPIPHAFHSAGPDANLTWHAWVACRPHNLSNLQRS
ncbi:MAG: methyltransferase domain-containing protein [Myxococcaceae bacterium]|nr:methyltransferase domain-containing protein [Myxococcaceae bacterium]